MARKATLSVLIPQPNARGHRFICARLLKLTEIHFSAFLFLVFFSLVLLSVAVVIAATWLARTGSFFSNSCTLSLCLNFSVVCFTQKIFILHKFLLLDY